MNRGDTPRRRLSSEESRIPVPSSPILRRSGSQRLSNFSPIAEHARNGTTTNRTPPLHRHRSLQCLSTTQVSACLSPDRDDDVDSVQSFGSAASVASSAASQCDHVSFARNGTTYSSRQKRFVVHCSPHNDPGEEYLTPTQRANRTIRKLKHLLQDKQTELIDKEREIFRLTKEVVELRLVKAASASTSTIDVAATANHDHHNGPRSQNVQGGSRSPPTTPLSRKEVVNVIDQGNSLSTTDGVAPVAPPLADVPASLVDSGHFEDLTSSSSARDWSHSPHSSPSVSQPVAPSSTPNQIAIIERIKQHHEDELREISHKHNDELREINRKHNNELREIDQKHNDELRELKENYNDEVRELKERHNDKIDSLLQRITEANDRFCELRPKLEEAENRIKVLEVENEDIKRSQQEAEEKHKTIYLQMYNKGHEAAKLESDMHQGNGDAGSNSILTENEKLLKELNLTKKDLENVKANYRRLLETRQSVSQQDPEITLNFLKSAVYYFLTDRENSQRHLSAIESILGFTDNEKMNIEKAYLWR